MVKADITPVGFSGIMTSCELIMTYILPVSYKEVRVGVLLMCCYAKQSGLL